LIDEKQIILFDGVCIFCNFWVNFVIKRDKEDIFRFAALQSKEAEELSGKFKFDSTEIDTFILIAGEKFYAKSTAALMVCKELSGLLKLLYPSIILPVFFRDFIYDLIAGNRFKLFGRRNSCRVPTEAEREKFL
jgi:predicted DCC family thiol-disulfide oxidoreductase YuxK